MNGSHQFSASAPGDPLRIGAGFLGWVLDKKSSGQGDGRVELVDAALDARVQAVWFAFGSDLGRYVRYVRAEDLKRNADQPRPHKTLVFVQVNSVEEARVVVHEWAVDVLVVQGELFSRIWLLLHMPAQTSRIDDPASHWLPPYVSQILTDSFQI